jgi:hypothetical protein
VTCDDIVIATHNPLMGLTNIAPATLFQTKLALYTSYRGRRPDEEGSRRGRAVLGHRRTRTTMCESSRIETTT